MKRPTLEELAVHQFDIFVVGGGVIGCGVARDAALRGLRVALVEADDFGSGTTSRSTRLIHGGLRYLELYDFGLVREDMRERETLLRIAPHLVRPLPFLVPMYRLSLYQRVRLRAGMVLYDALSFDKSLPGHRFLSKAETIAAQPSLDRVGLQGAALYFDGQVAFPERLCIENVLDAAEHGARLRNYTRAERILIEDRRAVGASLRDTRTGEQGSIRASLTINVTGAWLDHTLAQIRDSAAPLLRTTKGAHVVTSPLSTSAVVLFARADGRLFFVVPWHGLSLIGTTDTDESGPPERARADPSDVDYLLRETRRAFPSLAHLTPYYAMAGLRALVRKEGVPESDVSRKHAIHDHALEGGPTGLLSVVGGKLTGYRAIAEEVVDLACRVLGHATSCSTARRVLPGAGFHPAELQDELEQLAKRVTLSGEELPYLIGLYGSKARQILALAEGCPELAKRAHPQQPTILAEVSNAAREESALSLADVLLRRTPLGLTPGHALDVTDQIAQVLGDALGWSSTERIAEIERYKNHLAEMYSLPAEPAEV